MVDTFKCLVETHGSYLYLPKMMSATWENFYAITGWKTTTTFARLCEGTPDLLDPFISAAFFIILFKAMGIMRPFPNLDVSQRRSEENVINMKTEVHQFLHDEAHICAGSCVPVRLNRCGRDAHDASLTSYMRDANPNPITHPMSDSHI